MCPQPLQSVATSTFVMLLPQLDLQSVYNLFDFSNGPWVTNAVTWLGAGSNAAGIAERPPVFVCPSDESEPLVVPKPVYGPNTLGRPAATGSYATCAGSIGAAEGLSSTMKYRNNGVFYYLSRHRVSDITDGLGNTMFVGEVVGASTDAGNKWTSHARMLDCHRATSNPLNTPPGEPIYVVVQGLKENGAFGSRHPGGANFSFGDGHVAFLEDNIDLQVYKSLSTRDGGETLDGSP